jgi:hypothetical protein
MATQSGSDGSPSQRPESGRRSIFAIIGMALLGAVMGAIFLPMTVFFAALILAGLTSGCANDSGGCAMWAGSVAIASVPVGAAIVFGLALYSGLKSR